MNFQHIAKNLCEGIKILHLKAGGKLPQHDGEADKQKAEFLAKRLEYLCTIAKIDTLKETFTDYQDTEKRAQYQAQLERRLNELYEEISDSADSPYGRNYESR